MFLKSCSSQMEKGEDGVNTDVTRGYYPKARSRDGTTETLGQPTYPIISKDGRGRIYPARGPP